MTLALLCEEQEKQNPPREGLNRERSVEQHKLAVIMFTDMVGYSVLSQRHAVIDLGGMNLFRK